MTEETSHRDARVLLIGNKKGGVAETTTTLNLASALVERSNKVLVVDLDMTGGATKALKAPRTEWPSSWHLMTGEVPPLDCVIHHKR